MKTKSLSFVLAFLAIVCGGMRASALYVVDGYYTLGSQTEKSDKNVTYVSSAYYKDSDTRSCLNSTYHTSIYATKQPAAGTVLTNWTLTGLTSASVEKTTTYSASETQTLTYSTCVKNGYAENGATGNMSSQSLRLVANYRWMNYTLSYDANGGSWGGDSPTAQSLTYPDTITTLAAGRATKTGYHIASWNTAKDGSGTKVACGSSGVTGATLGVTADGEAVTLYAQWAANTYAVTLSADGAENTPTTSVEATYDAAMPAIAVLPTRTGYTFGGYYTEQDGRGTQYYKADGSSAANCDLTAATTLHAKWSINSYTVTFDVQGNGTVSPSGSRTYEYGTVVNVSATPSTGATFGGWSDGVTTQTRTVTVTGNATYTAIFSLTTCTVTFVYYNKNCVLTTESTTYDYGDTIAVPTDVDNRPGYTFTGWSPSVPTTATASGTYTAQYSEKTYSVFFDGNGDTSGRTATQAFSYSESKALTKCGYKKTGYSFLGWSEKKGATKADYADQEVVGSLAEEGAITLYAVWQANSYTVEFDGNGETGGSMPSQTFTYDKEQTLRKNGFTKVGQTFVAWKTEDGRTFADGATVKNLTDSGTITLHAGWSGDHFVVFDGNGATSGEMGVQTFTRDDEQALTPNAYGKTGYTFGGWATNEATAAELSPRYSDGEVVSIDAPEGATNTLYAVWTTNRYSIVFHPGAANVIGTNETLTGCFYDTEITLPKCAYTNHASSGFLGWAQADGGEVAFSDGAVVSNLTAEADGIAALYAVWDDEGELSKAVGLANGVLTSVEDAKIPNFKWSAIEGVGHGDDKCVAPTGEPYSLANGEATMTMTVCGPGKLSFYWYHSDEDTEGDHGYEVKLDGTVVASCASTEWKEVELAIDEGEHTVEWVYRVNYRGVSSAPLYVDDMTWTPTSQTEEEFSYDDDSGVTHTVSVPHSWVDGYFSADDVTAAGGYKSLLEGSANKSGWSVPRWQEYVAGTDPTDSASVFRITSIEVTNGGVSLTWSPDLREADPPRTYTVFGKAALDDAGWTTPADSTHRFFKVKVGLK